MIRAVQALEAGDETALSTLVRPNTAVVSSLTYSTDSSVLKLSGNTVKALEDGTATITADAIIDEHPYSTELDVTVAPLEYGLTSSRTATDIALARVPDIIEVGEEFAVQAYILSAITTDHPWPYSYYDDNLAKYTSSDPSVCRVKNGVLLGVSTGTATITVSDLSETVQKTFTVNVVEQTSLQHTDAEVLNVNAADYDWTTAETTTLAIINILSAASAAGKKKVVFPNQIYNVSPAYGTIYIPTQMIVDFSGSVVQIEPSAMTSTGYQMFCLNATQYSSIENAIIYGERDLIDGTGTEGCVSVNIAGCSYRSGLKNCTISKSPGFNISFGNTNRTVKAVAKSSIEAGGIDANGNDVAEDYSFRSNAYVDISAVGKTDGRFWLGNVQGFGGYLYLSARVYNIFFYDADKTFISALHHCIQYYAYKKPEGAVYARISFWQGSAPTSGDPDYGAIAHIHSYDKPERCYISHCTLEDNYSTAIAPNGGESMLVEYCTFKNNGYRDPASHLDWEDGRQHNKGHILRYNTFEGGGAVTAVGADGLVIHNNTFTQVPLNIGDEVQNSRIWLNRFIKCKATITPKTDDVFSQNYGYDGGSYTLNTMTDVGFAVRETANSFE